MSSYPYYQPRTPQPIDTRELIIEWESLQEQDSDEDPLDDEGIERRDSIRALLDELSSNSGDSPSDGITLIPEGGFEEYARLFAEDVEGIDMDSPLATYVDWERYAADVQTDYSSVEFDGTTYYYR